MRQLECFKALDKKKYIVWTDTGNHFRCAEFMYYLFVELAQIQIEVSFNLFCEKHGKNSRDQHFSVVSNFIQQESFVKKLTSSQDICDAIEKHQMFANIDKERLNLSQKPTTRMFKKTITKAYVIPEHKSMTYTSLKMFITGVKNYYNFFTDNLFNLKTHFMSDQENFILLEPRLINHNSKVKKNYTPDKIEPIVIEPSYLNKKMFNWKRMQRLETNQINQSEISSDTSFDLIINLNSFHCIEEKCSNCRSVCKFRLSELNYRNNLLTQIQIINELKEHGHPKSRKNKDRTNRTLKQARIELKNHYIKYHM